MGIKIFSVLFSVFPLRIGEWQSFFLFFSSPAFSQKYFSQRNNDNNETAKQKSVIFRVLCENKNGEAILIRVCRSHISGTSLPAGRFVAAKKSAKQIIFFSFFSSSAFSQNLFLFYHLGIKLY